MSKPPKVATPGHDRKLRGEVKPDEQAEFTVYFGDDVYEVSLSRVSANVSAQLDKAIGLGPKALGDRVNEGHMLEPHIMGAMLWLGRLQAGERLTYEQATEGLTFGSVIEGVLAGVKARTDAAPSDDVDEPVVVEEPGDPKGSADT